MNEKIIKISMLGASSTGKTKVAKRVAEACDLMYVDELAATYIREGKRFTQPQLLYEQYQKEIDATYKAIIFEKNGYITDCDLRLTKIYTPIRNPSETKQLNKLFNILDPKYDMTFFANVNENKMLEDNGSRFLDEETRKCVQSMIKTFLLDDPTIHIVNRDMNVRTDEIIGIIYNYLETKNE